MIQNVGPMVFLYQDINQAYAEMQQVKGEFTDWEETRNGRALAFQYPVLLHALSPQYRVLFCPFRDANPFFHYMEAIWMLSGSENVDFPSYFAKNIRQYSDDGITLHGAYGYRWREAFEVDQIESVIHMLRTEPQSRRMVISMWDPHLDLEVNSKDLPCNTQLYFRVIQGALSMTVLNRSNDLVWGMLGANFVHFSILLEYMAEAAELEMGPMYQFTNNLHVYEGWETQDKFGPASNWYRNNPTIKRWLFGPTNLDIDEAKDFVENWKEYSDSTVPKCRILRDNAAPMLLAYNEYKDGNIDKALHYAERIHDDDWKEACWQWLMRRNTQTKDK
jgi:thymidylate synthase